MICIVAVELSKLQASKLYFKLQESSRKLVHCLKTGPLLAHPNVIFGSNNIAKYYSNNVDLFLSSQHSDLNSVVLELAQDVI